MCGHMCMGHGIWEGLITQQQSDGIFNLSLSQLHLSINTWQSIECVECVGYSLSSLPVH